MDYFNEIMGLIIVLLVLLFPFLRRLIEMRYRKKHPELFKKEQEAKEAYLKELQKRLAEENRRELEEEKEYQLKEPPPPSHKAYESPHTDRLVKAGYEFHTKLEKFKHKNAISTRSFETSAAPEFKKNVVSPAFLMGKKGIEKVITDKSARLKQMVISYEIFGKPISLKPDWPIGQRTQD